jgi:iron(III) transport system substrate-binding protein
VLRRHVTVVGRWAWAFVLLIAAGCSHDHRTVVLVYSPHGKELLEDYANRFMRVHPDIDLQWDDMGSTEVLDRVRAERDNPQADVWFGAPAELFERATREGLLEAYTPTWADDVPPEAHDSAGFWFGTYLTPEVIGYNNQAVTAAEAPKDWDDVLDPRWKGKLVIRDPVASGGMRAIFGAILERSIAATGSTAAGWNWLRRLDVNTKEYTLNPTILYQKLARREGVITLFDMPDLAMLQQRDHIPVSYVFPESGTPLLVDAIAIVKGAHHPDAARAFYEFVTSEPMLVIAARDHLRIPARIDIEDDSLPQWIRTARQQLKPMPMNRAMLADSLDGWMTYWDSHIRHRG